MTFKEMVSLKLKKMGKDELWLKKELEKRRYMTDQDFDFDADELDDLTTLFVMATLKLTDKDFKLMNLSVIK